MATVLLDSRMTQTLSFTYSPANISVVSTCLKTLERERDVEDLMMVIKHVVLQCYLLPLSLSVNKVCYILNMDSRK